MKKRSVLSLAFLWLSVIFNQLYALAPKQKIFPNDLYKSGMFSRKVFHSDNTLFVSDPEYKTTDVSRGCNIGYGAMHIYKQVNGNWTFNQLILPDYNSTFENKLGRKHSYRNNVLVLSAEREDYSASVLRAGAFYVYSRASQTSNFTRIAKIFAPTPGFGEEFSAAGVATNGNKIVLYYPFESKLYLYNVSGSSVTLATSLNIGNGAGEIQGITDNNIVVLQNGNAVRLFRIDGSSFTELSATSLIPTSGSSRVLGGLASVNGTSVVFSAFTNFSSGTSDAYIRVAKLGYNGVENVTDIDFPLGLTYRVDTSSPAFTMNPYIEDLSIKENSSIAICISKGYKVNTRNRVALLNYIDGKYRQSDILESPWEYDQVMESWGSSVALSSNQVFIGDHLDRTNSDSGTTPCDRKNPSGALYVYDIKPAVNNGANGSRILTTVFKESYDETAAKVAINGNYALVSHSGSDDASENAGAVSLLKNINGQWYFEKKLYSILSDENEYFGSDVALSSTFAAIGSKGYYDSRGLVQVYQILSSSGVKIEDAAYTFVPSPDNIPYNFFGDAVATDGNYLAVTASGDDSQGTESGAVYIFNWNGTSWLFVQKILSPVYSAFQEFGISISIKGDYLVVGAPKDDNERGINAGASYIYRLSGGSFIFSQKLIPSGNGADQLFGQHVSIAADYVAISHKNTVTNQGAVSVFKRTNQTWSSPQTLTESGSGLAFGSSCSVDGNRLLIGSPSQGKVYRYENYYNWAKSGAFSIGNTTYSAIDVAINGDKVIMGDVANDGNGGEAYVMYFHQMGGAREGLVEESALLSSELSPRVFPNPASGSTVSVMGVENIQSVKVYSVEGTYINNLTIRNGEIDISSLESGLYFLHIQGLEGTRIFKFSVQ